MWRSRLRIFQMGGSSVISRSLEKPRSPPASTAMMGPRNPSRMMSTGRLLSVAPSTYACFSVHTGGNTPGMAIEARSHSHTLPRRCTASWPFVRLAETQ